MKVKNIYTSNYPKNIYELHFQVNIHTYKTQISHLIFMQLIKYIYIVINFAPKYYLH